MLMRAVVKVMGIIFNQKIRKGDLTSPILLRKGDKYYPPVSKQSYRVKEETNSVTCVSQSPLKKNEVKQYKYLSELFIYELSYFSSLVLGTQQFWK